MQIKDMSGERFGRLLVLLRAYPMPGKPVHWDCLCDCGRRCVVDGSRLRSQVTRSCGCLARDAVSERNFRHGMKGSPEYRAWAGMRTRCTNPRVPGYIYYGGRGISFAPEWNDFLLFYEHVGPRP